MAELAGKLQAAGITAEPPTTAPVPASLLISPATQPDRKARRVVFVLDSFGVIDTNAPQKQQIIQGIEALQDREWFNVVVAGSSGPVSFQPKLCEAMRPQKQRVAEFLRTCSAAWHAGPLPSLQAAMQWKPDVIWFVSYGNGNPEEILAGLREANRLTNARINTTTAFVSVGASANRWLMWKIAQESGGICVDGRGQIITQEPPRPAERKQPDPPRPPTLLKE